MTLPWHKPQFYTNANWSSRREEPTAIAGRLGRYLDRLGQADETLVPWVIGKRRKARYGPERRDLGSLVEQRYGEDGKKDVDAGYAILCSSQDPRQLYSTIGTVGSIYGGQMWNYLTFATNGNDEANPTIVTYRLMKAATLTMIECWEPAFCITRSNQLTPDYKNEGRFTKAWMTYVPPAQVANVDLVGVPFSERTADGGLLLSATEDIFDPNNPVHLEAAGRISDALQPLNATLPAD